MSMHNILALKLSPYTESHMQTKNVWLRGHCRKLPLYRPPEHCQSHKALSKAGNIYAYVTRPEVILVYYSPLSESLVILTTNKDNKD